LPPANGVIEGSHVTWGPGLSNDPEKQNGFKVHSVMVVEEAVIVVVDVVKEVDIEVWVVVEEVDDEVWVVTDVDIEIVEEELDVVVLVDVELVIPPPPLHI
jgi:hypothetical protein